MTETVEVAQIAEALAMIDHGLVRLQSRELVSSTEVADLLLDVRSVLCLLPGPAATN